MKLARSMRKIASLCLVLFVIASCSWVFGMAQLPTGGYGWSDFPLQVRYSAYAAGFFFGSWVLLFLGALTTSALAESAILEKGEPATATILKVSDTGVTINKDPVVRLTLEVSPPNHPPFEAEVERRVSRLAVHQLQPGTVVQVKYDPANHAVALVQP